MTRSSLRLIGAIALGNALVPLNSTMLVVALPAIARDAGVDLAAASWLGLVAALQALPSSGDAVSLWQVAKWHLRRGNVVAVVAYPLALTIQLTNWLRLVWVDWLYAGVLIWVATRLAA